MPVCHPEHRASLGKARWQSWTSQKIAQPRKFNDEFGGDCFGDQVALWGGMNLVEMTLAQRLLQKLGDAFVQGAIKDRVRDRPDSVFDAFVVFRRPFF
jgi:hypothetical protein